MEASIAFCSSSFIGIRRQASIPSHPMRHGRETSHTGPASEAFIQHMSNRKNRTIILHDCLYNGRHSHGNAIKRCAFKPDNFCTAILSMFCNLLFVKRNSHLSGITYPPEGIRLPWQNSRQPPGCPHVPLQYKPEYPPHLHEALYLNYSGIWQSIQRSSATNDPVCRKSEASKTAAVLNQQGWIPQESTDFLHIS